MAKGYTEEELVDIFREYGYNDTAIAGMLSNMYAESGLHANNLENGSNAKYGMSDQEYTDFIDSKLQSMSYADFKNSPEYKLAGPGAYGLYQNIYKGDMFQYAADNGFSIADPRAQIGYVTSQMQSSNLYDRINAAKDPTEAASIFYWGKEMPINRNPSPDDTEGQRLLAMANSWEKAHLGSAAGYYDKITSGTLDNSYYYNMGNGEGAPRVRSSNVGSSSGGARRASSASTTGGTSSINVQTPISSTSYKGFNSWMEGPQTSTMSDPMTSSIPQQIETDVSANTRRNRAPIFNLEQALSAQRLNRTPQAMINR